MISFQDIIAKLFGDNRFGSFSTSSNLSNLASTGNTHVQVALLGDSITNRNFAGVSTPFLTCSGIGIWNWANWVLGAPFLIEHTLAVDGDTTLGIFSRASSVPADVQVVFCLGGINDILTGVPQATTIANIGNGVANLVAAGKKVVISTILPQNALSAPQLTSLLAINTYIKTLASSSVFVVDGFTAMGGNPATGAAPAGYINADNTHPTAAGAQAFGIHTSTKTALTAAFKSCIPDANPYKEYKQNQPLYSEMRRNTGGTVGQLIYAGWLTGTIADAWTIFRSVGTASGTMDATQAYVAPTTFIGPAANRPASIDSYTQNISITSSAANDQLTMQYLPTILGDGSNSFLTGIYPGCKFFAEMEIELVTPANIANCWFTNRVYFTQGQGSAFTGGTGGVSSANLVVTAVASGSIQAGQTLYNNGVSLGVTVLYQSVLTAGVGNTGTYVLSGPVTLANGTATLTTAPITDVPYVQIGGTNVSSGAGSTTDSASVDTVSLQAGRFLMRSPVMVAPININGSVALQSFKYLYINCLGNAAGTVIKVGKPRLYIQNSGRLG